MKRQYETPRAEIVIFDYTDTVVACSNVGCWGWCWWHPENCTNPQGSGTQEVQTTTPPAHNPYYAPGWGKHCS